MSLRELYNELTWKVYRLIHKPTFWLLSVLFIAAICGVVTLIVKVDDIAYSRMMKSPDIVKCVEYLQKYPQSEHAGAVENLLVYLRIKKEKEDYDQVCQYTTIDNCKSFLSQYPQSEYFKDVEGKLIVLEYDKAVQSLNIYLLRDFVDKYPQSFRVKEVNKIIKKVEDDFYKNYVNLPIAKVHRSRVNEYLTTFPNGRYVSQAKAKLHDLDDEDAYNKASSSNTKLDWQDYLSNYPKGLHVSYARSRIKEFEEIEYYSNYSLSNGAQPYASYYGSNFSYAYDRAFVEVLASDDSDVLVLIRYNNAKGKVAGHSYIRKGCRSTIYLPSERRYQVFFYHGSGWYPKKKMNGGVKGGFLCSEQFSKDDESIYLGYGQGVSYTLTKQVNGNFSTSGSSENEMF